MAVNEIVIKIDNSQTKKEKKKEKLTQKTEEQDKKQKKIKKLKAIQETITEGTREILMDVNSAALDTLDTLDYGIQAIQIKNVQSVVSRVSNAAKNIAAGAKYGGAPGAIVTAVVEVAKEGIAMVQRNIQWNEHQQENNISASRASDRLGIVAENGNRNYKL